MSDNYANLGTAAVLDPSQLRVGQYTEIDGQVLVVDKIVDDLHVYFRPVKGRELWLYRWRNLSTAGIIVLCTVGVAVVWLIVRIL
jgi:hypothetical protein